MKRKLFLRHSLLTLLGLTLLICIPLLLQFLFPYNSKDAKIPHGWEAVYSTEQYTYIRMKDGENAHVWVENYDHEGFYMDLVLPNDKTYATLPYQADGNTQVILYFGYGKLYYDQKAQYYQYYLNHDAPPDNQAPYQLYMHRSYQDFGVVESTLLMELPDFSKEVSIDYRPKSHEIGYTQALILNVPMELFETHSNAQLSFQLLDKKEYRRAGDGVYLTHDVQTDTFIVESEHCARQNAINNSFPHALLSLMGVYVYGNLAMILLALVFALLTTIRRRRYHLPYCMMAGGLLLSAILTIISDYNITDPWDFSFLLFLFALIVYGVLAFFIALMQSIRILIAEHARKKKAKTNKPETTSADE